MLSDLFLVSEFLHAVKECLVNFLFVIRFRNLDELLFSPLIVREAHVRLDLSGVRVLNIAEFALHHDSLQASIIAKFAG